MNSSGSKSLSIKPAIPQMRTRSLRPARTLSRTTAVLLAVFITTACDISISLSAEPEAAGAQSGEPVSNLSVDDVIARYVAAIGGYEKVRNVRTLISRGEYREGGTVLTDGALVKMRPYYKLVGDPKDTNPEFREGYDGSAWEYYRDPGVVLRTVGAAAAASRHGSWIDGPLVDYREKGSTAKLEGEELVDGKKTYRIRVRMLDGFEQDEFIDADKWLLIAERKVTPVHAFGDKITREERWSDFREVEGVLFPFLSNEVEIATGKILGTMKTLSLNVNEELDPAIFSPPEIKRNDLQRFMELLYQERSDVEAVMWTYEVFRKAHASLSTDESSQVIGYQILKMGDIPAAVQLLEANARDYPDSSGAAFGLGRAYQTATRLDKAKEEFRRALQLDPKNKRASEALKKL